MSIMTVKITYKIVVSKPLEKAVIKQKFKAGGFCFFDSIIKHFDQEDTDHKTIINKANKLKDEYEAKMIMAQDASVARMNSAVAESKGISVAQLAALEETLAKDMLKQELKLEKFCSTVRSELEDISLATAAMMIEKITHNKIDQKDLKKYLLQ
jgi:hypothetical protein